MDTQYTSQLHSRLEIFYSTTNINLEDVFGAREIEE